MTPLVPEKPNLVKSAILRATFNDWEKTPTIVDALINGYNIDPRAYYRYGEEDYYYGLPAGHRPQVIVRDAELEDILASIHGVTTNEINVSILTFSSYSQNTAGRWYMAQQGDLDITTGLISGLEFVPEGHVAEVNSVEIKEVYDSGDGNVAPELLYVELTAQLTHFHPDTPTQTTDIEHYVGDITEADLNLKRFDNRAYNAVYKVLNTETNEYSVDLHFIYDPDLELYDELDVYEEEDLDSPYYPIAPIRLDKEWLEDGHPAYESVSKILKYISTDINDIQEALRDNPDVDDIDSSYILLAMPIGKDHPRDNIDCKYLYKYFTYLKNSSRTDKEKFESSLNQANVASNIIQIRDSDFRTSLHWNYVEEDEEFYNENKAGQYEMFFYLDYDSDEKVGKDDNFYSKSYIQINYHDKLTETAKVIRVHGLYHVSEVYHEKVVINTLSSVFHWDEDERTDGFFIPLSEDIMNTLSKRDYTHVAFSGLILVNYAIVKTKIKWYQRKAFWRLVQIVLVIISIWTMQPQLAALASYTASEIAYLVIQSIVVNYLIGEAIGYVLSILADVIGGEAAVLIAAIIAAVAMIYGVGGQFNLKLPFADEVLKLSNLMMTEIEKLQQIRAKRLQEEITSFKSEYEQLQEEIDVARDLLDTDSFFNPYWVLEGSSILAGESSSDFLLRNINPNPNELSIQAVTNFTENALRLPTLASVNNNFRGF